jgi:hypothetical protein
MRGSFPAVGIRRRARKWQVAVLATIGMAVAALVTAPAAMARADSGWHLAHVFGAADRYPDLEGISVTSPTLAWLTGNAALALPVEEWNGHKWTALVPPARFANPAEPANDDVVSAVSRTDMWTFPNLGGDQYALRWNGARWATYRLPDATAIFGTAVFGSTDVWAFGQAPARQPAFGFGQPFLARFNGHKWHRGSIPGVPTAVSALSARDIWAFGPTTATASNPRPSQDVVAMHWAGKGWSELPIPRQNGDVVIGALATAPASLWVVEEPSGPPTGAGPPGSATPMLILHWDRSGWHQVVSDSAAEFQGSIAPDGHGGLWLQVLDVSTQRAEFLHYNEGRLTQVAVPAVRGYTADGASLALVPGTRLMWALVGMNPDSIGEPSKSAVATYTP